MTDLEFTGERYIPGAGGARIAAEHVHRYELVAPLARGRRALDLACGEGYGAALLAESAADVVAVDVDEATIAHARARYGDRKCLRFELADARALPLSDGAVDFCVALEMIEHVEDPETVLAEISRVLSPDGVLVISSPNAAVAADAAPEENPFHLRVLDEHGIRTLLEGHFPAVQLFGQALVAGSCVWDPGAVTDAIVASGMDRLLPKYFLALAGKDPGWSIRLPPSFQVDAEGTILEEGLSFWRELEAVGSEHAIAVSRAAAFEASARNNERRAYDAGRRLLALESEMAHRLEIVGNVETECHELREALSARGAELVRLREQNLELRESLGNVLGSTSWRATRPLRSLRRSTRPEAFPDDARSEGL